MLLVLALLAVAAGAPSSAYDSGVAAFDRGDWVEADRRLTRAVAGTPASAEALTYLGLARLRLGRAAEARTDLAAAARLAPSDARIRIRLARALGDGGERAAAAQAVAEALALAPDDAFVLHQAGLLAARSGRSDEALARLEAAAHRAPGEARYWYDLGVARQKTTKPALQAAAIAAYGRALAADPGLKSAYVNLGALLLDSARPAAATDAFRRALALAPADAPIHFNLALALERTGDRKAARHEALEAARLGLDTSALHYFLGVAAKDAGETAAAEASFRTSVARDPANRAALCELASLRLLAGDAAGAASVLGGRDDDVAADPDLALVAARVAAKLGQADRAGAILDAALAKSAKDPDLLYARAQSLLDQSGRRAEAEELLRRYEAESARTARALDAALAAAEGRKLRAAGDARAAAAALARALALDPSRTADRLELARAHLALGEIDAARREITAALAARADDPDAHRLHAELLLRGGAREAAVAALEVALALDPLDAATGERLAALLEEVGRREAAEDLKRELAQLQPTIPRRTSR